MLARPALVVESNDALGRAAHVRYDKADARIQFSGMPLVTTFETRGGLHAHIAFIGSRDITERLKRSRAFGEFIQVDSVTDPGGLARKYLAKERTPQAGYRRHLVLGGRLPGSHRLDGGGDRVRLSRDLERDAISAGYVEPWQHTNAGCFSRRAPESPWTSI